MTLEQNLLADLPHEFPRALTRDAGDLAEWPAIEPFLTRLADEIDAAENAEDLRRWLNRRDELDTVVDEAHTRRYIAMTCQTDDPARERAWLDVIEHALPKLKPWHDRLARAWLAHPARAQLDRDRLAVHDRRMENEAALFREVNVALQTDEARLAQEYQKLSGAMTVSWRGEEKTLQQMAIHFEDNDRAVREEAWRLVAERRARDRTAMDGLFNQLIALRGHIAHNADFTNFRDYQHRAYHRFDYTSADCEAFHDAIEREVVPLLATLRQRRRERLGVERLRPWDLYVDPERGAPLRPFSDAGQLAAGCETIFRRIDPELGEQFATMQRLGLLELDSRKGKAPGGYQSDLAETRLPFIFMNAAGSNRDVFTLLHEGGHAFHAFAAREQTPAPYRHAPMEFSEVASMTMELFGMGELDTFYPNADDRRRARRRQLEDVVTILPWVATVDAFQHWLYLHPEHTVAEREAHWSQLQRRFSPEVDATGLEDLLRGMWQRQLHLFEVPFYYVEYGIAQLGALQVWRRFRETPEAATADYRRALALGGSRPLPELFAAAGARFDFTAETLRPLMATVADALEA